MKYKLIFAFSEREATSESKGSSKPTLFDSTGEGHHNSCSETDTSEPISEQMFKTENSSHEQDPDQSKQDASDNELDSEPKDDSDDDADLEASKEKTAAIQQKPCRKVRKTHFFHTFQIFFA